jgi:hypothetical protein
MGDNGAKWTRVLGPRAGSPHLKERRRDGDPAQVSLPAQIVCRDINLRLVAHHQLPHTIPKHRVAAQYLSITLMSTEGTRRVAPIEGRGRDEQCYSRATHTTIQAFRPSRGERRRSAYLDEADDLVAVIGLARQRVEDVGEEALARREERQRVRVLRTERHRLPNNQPRVIVIINDILVIVIMFIVSNPQVTR